MSTLWPAAAAAWSQAMSFGRDLRPSLATPRAMAPLETTTTLRFWARAAATSAARRSHASPESDFDPILITTRRDFVIALRMRPSSLARDSAGASASFSISTSAIAAPGRLGHDLIERGFEATLDVARQRGAREQHGVDPARELVAQVFEAVGHRGFAGLERRRKSADHGAIDHRADLARLF